MYFNIISSCHVETIRYLREIQEQGKLFYAGIADACLKLVNGSMFKLAPER
jgi:hypothetical protein